MRPQAADIDWTQLDERERKTLEEVIPLVEEGYTHAEIAEKLGGDAKTIEADVERLAARLMALSGSIELPPLNADELEALEQSLAEHGQQMPILRGSKSSGLPGVIVDGKHRRRILARLKIEPVYKDVDGTADQLRALGLVLNMARRHMSASSRRGVVRAKLLADPTLSDRAIAAAIGVDGKTVGAVRRELEQKGDVAKHTTRRGTDGVAQPVRDRAPQPPPEHRSVRVLVPHDLYEQWVGGWVSCKAFRLVERRPGVHELQVQLLDASEASDAQLQQVRAYIERVAAKTNTDPETAAAELLRTASEVFGREIPTLEELLEDEADWLSSRIGVLVGKEPAPA